MIWAVSLLIMILSLFLPIDIREILGLLAIGWVVRDIGKFIKMLLED